MAAKLGRMVTCLNGLLPLKSHNPLSTWSYEIMSETKTTICTIRVPMATKLVRMLTYFDGLFPIKSDYRLIT